MRRKLGPLAAIIVASCIVTSCAAPPPPAPIPEPPPLAAPAAPSEPAAVGTVRVNSATLNVRREPSTTGEVVAQAKKGDRLALLANRGEWSNVRLTDGTTGWVSSKLVTGDSPSQSTSTATSTATSTSSRRRGGCPADADFHFIQAPLPSFSDNSSAHGIVTVDANVDARGMVTSTRVVSNTTGDPAAATVAEREIRNAKFAPPVRGCAAKAFIYTYKRTF